MTFGIQMLLSGSFKNTAKENSRIHTTTSKQFGTHDRHTYEKSDEVKEQFLATCFLKFIVLCDMIVVNSRTNLETDTIIDSLRIQSI